MKAEDLEIGDVVRYENYHSGVKFCAYARINSKLDANNYFALSDLMDHKRIMGHHHKDSVIAKVLATGEAYKEIRLETSIRRFSADDSFLFADPKNHCPQCAKNI